MSALSPSEWEPAHYAGALVLGALGILVLLRKGFADVRISIGD